MRLFGAFKVFLCVTLGFFMGFQDSLQQLMVLEKANSVWIKSMFIAFTCALCGGLASWCVAFESPMGFEETPPTCRIAVPSLGQRESVGNGAETKRPPRQAMTHL
jgi:hypothetical protein